MHPGEGGGGGGAHGLQLIRESLGSWTGGGGGGGGGHDDDDDDVGFIPHHPEHHFSADQRLRESLDEYTQSRDGLRRELTAMAGELSQERSSWSSHSR